MNYSGSCHCGAIRFEIEADEVLHVEDCNCSICKKTGFLHLILPIQKFKILQGENNIQTYKFNTGTAKHTFCKICGVKPFYIPRSNPDGIDINLRCIDTPIKQMIINKFDGENWEENASKLAHKSKLTEEN